MKFMIAAVAAASTVQAEQFMPLQDL